MAEILIKDIEIPKKGNVGILIYADGSVEICGTGSLSKPIYGTPTTNAIEVPTHGRLGDLDKLYKVATAPYGNLYGFEALIKDIKTAPTIIEASTEEKE